MSWLSFCLAFHFAFFIQLPFSGCCLTGWNDADDRAETLFPNPCADAAGPTNDPGLRYNPQARPQISWGPGFWDSQGSYAKIAAGPKPDSTLPETALAIAFVTDPQYYSVTFDPAFQPEVDFSLTIQAGATLVATSTAAGDNRLVSNVPESMDEELSPETFSAIRGELTPPIRTRASSNSQATLHWVWMTR